MKDNMGKNWEITKEVIGRAKNDSQQAFREMYCQREKNSCKNEIANKFSNFFVKTGLKLAEKLQPAKYSS